MRIFKLYLLAVFSSRCSCLISPTCPAYRIRTAGIFPNRISDVEQPVVYSKTNLIEDVGQSENIVSSPKNDPEWNFFDTARINVKGGDGGDGCVAFRREKGISMGGPSGGNGSRGGSVIMVCDAGMNTLGTVRNRVHYRGLDGSNGQGKSRHAAAPKNSYMFVPPGTVVRDQDGVLCGELTEDKQELIVARGGRGGRGNLAFKTERNNAPKFMEVGEKGSERWLSLELKVVADVGIIGVPNAGKSTLLGALSNAKPKIADYPFTTVVPNLGVWEESLMAGTSPKGLVLADIPGLLEGAHTGVGLGLAFLRHVQRCGVLVHVIDGASPDPVGDYLAIQQELELFSPKLAKKHQVVVLNKIDIDNVGKNQKEIETELLKVLPHKRFMSISAAKRINTSELMHRVHKLVQSLPPEEGLFEGENIRVLDPVDDEGDRGFQILTDPSYPGQWRVTGTRIERTARMTNWEYYEAIVRFQRIMDAMGVNTSLKEAGAVKGDLIMIDEFDFEFSGEKEGSLMDQYLNL